MNCNPYRTEHLPYVDRLQQRPVNSVDLLVMHCTELPDLATARVYAEKIHYERSKTGNCGHYYIDRDGDTIEYVPVDRVAHHVANLNHRSVGIELVNRGRYPDWFQTDRQTMTEPYSEAQITALIELVDHLRGLLPELTLTAGHESLDTRSVPSSDDPLRTVPRKMDPGPQFPWPHFLAATGLYRVDENSLPEAPAAR